MKIMQIDAVLTEDCRHVLLIGHTADDNVTFCQGFELPCPITERTFNASLWVKKADPTRWRNAGGYGPDQPTPDQPGGVVNDL